MDIDQLRSAFHREGMMMHSVVGAWGRTSVPAVPMATSAKPPLPTEVNGEVVKRQAFGGLSGCLDHLARRAPEARVAPAAVTACPPGASHYSTHWTLARPPAHFPEIGLEPGRFLEDRLCA
jgi:hypothetical protein